MKFKGTPDMVIIDNKTHKAIGRFDENGIFEVAIPEYVERLKLFFPVIDDTPKRVCKTCGAKFDSQNQLLLHYKKEHPKDDSAGSV